MSLYLDADRAKIRSYSAVAKGPRAIVKIEIEVSDPAYLGYLLEDIGRMEREAERDRKARAEQEAAARKAAKRKALPEPPRLLTYDGGRK
jgi:hypothetical protein